MDIAPMIAFQAEIMLSKTYVCMCMPDYEGL